MPTTKKEQMEIIRAQTELEELRHKLKMEELEFERATTKIIHEQILERGRIQRAEDRKFFLEKQSYYRNRT